MELVFISYRRTDAQQAALGLYLQLRARVGPRHVFMDRSGIAAGDVWPKRLREAIAQASVVFALMGPGWLKASDEYGRRRLDMADDWVRSELACAIETGKPIIPVMLGGVDKMAPPQALPDSLRPIADRQSYTLRDDHWDSDFNDLVRYLVERHGFKEADKQVRLPQPKVDITPLTDAELHEELKELRGWEAVESLIPGDYPRSRHELRKVYVFKSFKGAIRFMSSAVDSINEIQHHPRWENQWRTVTVYLSTWDIQFKISRIDIDVAKILDRVFQNVMHTSQQGRGSSNLMTD